jgi:hypothetical protein
MPGFIEPCCIQNVTGDEGIVVVVLAFHDSADRAYAEVRLLTRSEFVSAPCERVRSLWLYPLPFCATEHNIVSVKEWDVGLEVG